MTISSTTRTAGPYAGTGAQVIFSFAFKVFVNTDVLVVLTNNSTGSATVLNLTSDYTVLLNADQNNNPGGTITAVVAPAVGISLSITSQVPLLQPTDIANVGNFYPKAVTDAFDRACIQIQQQGGSIGSTVRGTIGEALTTLPPAATRASKVLAFDSLGQPTLMVPPTGSGTALAISLADPALTNGAYLVNRATPQINNITTLRTLAGRYDGDVCYVLGYYSTSPGQGGGLMYWSAASVVADDSGTVFQVGGVGTGRWLRIYSRLEVTMFGAVPGAGTDRTTSIQAARDFVAAQTPPPVLYFTAGIYQYSVSPNWAIQNVNIRAEGTVYLRYTGVGNAVIIDAGSGAQLCFSMSMGAGGNRFIVQAPSTALNGVYVRSVHHSHLGFRVDGCGSTSAAIRIDFAVCTTLENPEASINSADGNVWYTGAKPAKGIWLSRRGVPEMTSYCTIERPVMEGVDIGIYYEWTLGNKINGGTCEACTSTGMSMTAGALRDVIDHTDFEVNTAADVFCSGSEIELRSIDSDSQVTIAAGALNLIRGGNFKNITINAGVTNARVDNVVYNRANTGGLLTDNGTTTRISNSQNAFGTQKPHDGKPTINGMAGSPASAWVNTTGNNIVVYTVGGTVTAINVTKPGLSANSTGQINGGVLLNPGDTIAWTYSVAPAVYYAIG